MPKEILGRIMYTVDEVAVALGVQPRTVRTYVRQGKIKGAKFNKRWHIREEELDKFITGENNKKKIGPNEALRVMLADNPEVVQAFESMDDNMRWVLNAWAEMDETQRAMLVKELEPKGEGK